MILRFISGVKSQPIAPLIAALAQDRQTPRLAAGGVNPMLEETFPRGILTRIHWFIAAGVLKIPACLSEGTEIGRSLSKHVLFRQMLGECAFGFWAVGDKYKQNTSPNSPAALFLCFVCLTGGAPPTAKPAANRRHHSSSHNPSIFDPNNSVRSLGDLGIMGNHHNGLVKFPAAHL